MKTLEFYDHTVFLEDLGKAMGVLPTQIISGLAMELDGGGFADGLILLVVQGNIGRVCYQQASIIAWCWQCAGASASASASASAGASASASASTSASTSTRY